MNIKETLEKKLGQLSDEEIRFAIEQYEKNVAQVGKIDKKISTSEALDELSMNIEFFRKRYCNIIERKKFVIREATRSGGSMELAYHVNKETNWYKYKN